MHEPKQEKNEENEQTLILLKPECVERYDQIGEKILSVWLDKGYTKKKELCLIPSLEVIESHYQEHKGKDFFDGLVKHMSSGKVMAYVFEGPNVVSFSRKMLGATNPLLAEPWTIRGRFALETKRNMVHASDSVESAKREINIWFP